MLFRSVSGYTYSFGAGYNDIWLVKYNSTGYLLWNRTAGGNRYEYGYSVVTDSKDNVYVTGWTSSFGAGDADSWLLKYNSSGNLIWNKTEGTTGAEYSYGVTIDSQDNVYTVNDNPSDDLWILKYNSLGSLLWEEILDSGSNSIDGNDILVDSEMDI